MQRRKKDALHVIYVQLPVRWIVFHFRRPRMKRAGGTLNFSESIFQDVFSAAFAKRHVLLMPFSLFLILKWLSMTGRIWFMKRNIYLLAVKGNIQDIISIIMQAVSYTHLTLP